LEEFKSSSQTLLIREGLKILISNTKLEKNNVNICHKKSPLRGRFRGGLTLNRL
jgi:hypothetical protein